MSKQQRGIFRRIFAAFGLGKWFTQKPTHHEYPDPSLRKRKRAHGGNRKEGPWNITKSIAKPKCEPGTITYRDWLVRHVGYDRRLADRMLRAWQEDSSIKLPLPSDAATLRELMRT